MDLGKRIARREFEISAPDASFIKVHFDYFSLPKGLAVEVFNRDGSEIYRYGNEQRDAYTFDAKIGQNGINSFAAMSIHGDVAKIRIVGTAQERWTAAHGIRVSRILEGFPEELKPTLAAEGLLAIGAGPKSICGVRQQAGSGVFLVIGRHRVRSRASGRQFDSWQRRFVHGLARWRKQPPVHE